MISVILVLYKTPLSKLKNIKKYNKFNLFIFEQEGSEKKGEILKNKLKFKFNYFFSKKNIGLPRAVNFLIDKVKTKYCLMTEPDIEINHKSILKLEKYIKKDKKFIIAGPIYIKKKNKNLNKKKINLNYKIKNFIDPSCVLFNVKLVKKIKFYDEDFYFYWDDIDLMERINKSKYKIIELQNTFAFHEESTSSESSIKIKLIKYVNFKYGELLFDYKHKKLRLIKILRQFCQNLVFTFFNLILFRKIFFKNIGYLIGIIKFILFFIFKKN
tara:strand:+ start:2645 stop:3454 length:810 start_codon:yes stop_codon:yes gene_type:complete